MREKYLRFVPLVGRIGFSLTLRVRTWAFARALLFYYWLSLRFFRALAFAMKIVCLIITHWSEDSLS